MRENILAGTLTSPHQIEGMREAATAVHMFLQGAYTLSINPLPDLRKFYEINWGWEFVNLFDIPRDKHDRELRKYVGNSQMFWSLPPGRSIYVFLINTNHDYIPAGFYGGETFEELRKEDPGFLATLVTHGAKEIV